MESLTQEEIINMIQGFDSEIWAKKSKFYEAVMSDGNIFNPYIHRRFLPYQFKRLINLSNNLLGTSTLEESVFWALERNYNCQQLFDYMQKEVELLSFLHRRDKIAFEERSFIYSVERCKSTLKDYIECVSNYSKSLLRVRNQINIKGVWVDITPLIEKINTMNDELQNVQLYRDLHKFLESRWEVAPEKEFALSDLFYIYRIETGGKAYENLREMFLLSGAYYSLKNHYMFSAGVIDREKTLGLLLQRLKSGENAISLTKQFCVEIGYEIHR